PPACNRTTLNCARQPFFYFALSRNSGRRQNWSTHHPVGRFSAFIALAHFTKVVPGIDAAGVAVVPGEAQRIAAHRLGFCGLDGLLIHRQQRGGGFSRFSGLALVTGTVLNAGGTRAGIAQPLEAVMRTVAVVPLDVNAGSSGDIYFD